MAPAPVPAEMKRRGREAVGQILPILQELALPRTLVSTTTGRGAFGAWFKVGFGDLPVDLPVMRAEWEKITSIEEAEAVMYTFGQYVADAEKEAEARGEAWGEVRGETRGKKEVILAFIRKVWGDAEAERVVPFLNAAELNDLPDISDLVDDQTAGRPPRLGPTGLVKPRT